MPTFHPHTLARPRTLLLLGGLAALAACGGSTPTTPSNPSGAGATSTNVTIVPNAANLGQPFNPASASVATTGTVHWRNADAGNPGDVYGGGATPGVTHTITADDGSFNSGNIAPGGTFDHTFATAGTFTYHCSIHPNMHGTVVVK